MCGHGPSGRNGGFCESLWFSAAAIRERFGDEPARRLLDASSRTVTEIGDWCREQRGGRLVRPVGLHVRVHRPGLRRGRAQRGGGGRGARGAGGGPGAEPGAGERALPLAPVQARRARPRLRHGAARAARARPAAAAGRARGVSVRALAGEGACAARGPARRSSRRRTGAASAPAPPCSRWARSARSIRPLRSRLTVSSSHIVLTEPVPDLLEEIGWTGGECITDGRTLLHYFRTTRDGRIALGWGGGRVACGARLGGRIEVDEDVARQARADLERLFPGLARATDRARLGRPDRRLPEPYPAGRKPAGRAGPLRVRVHRQRRGPVPPRSRGARLARARPPRRAHPSCRSSARTRAPGCRPSRSPGWAARWSGQPWSAPSARPSAASGPTSLTRAVCAVPKALGVHLAR